MVRGPRVWQSGGAACGPTPGRALEFPTNLAGFLWIGNFLGCPGASHHAEFIALLLFAAVCEEIISNLIAKEYVALVRMDKKKETL